MRTICLKLTLSLFICVASLVGAVSTEVDVGAGSTAVWLVPGDGWQGQAVLLLHGFADDRDGPADLTRRLAEALAAEGIASLRINFRGEGDKQRTDIASTRFTRVEDAVVARAWLVAQAGVDASRVGVLGFSLGGGTAIEVAGAHPEWFRSLALWSSVSGDLYAQLTTGEWAEVARVAREKGQGTLEIAGWKTVTLQRDFFESYRGLNLDEWLPRYPGAFFSLRGSGDHLPARELDFLKLAPGEPREAVLIGGADHIYNVFDPTKDYAARAIAVTVRWFGLTL